VEAANEVMDLTVLCIILFFLHKFYTNNSFIFVGMGAQKAKQEKTAFITYSHYNSGVKVKTNRD
jgi:hypothetical protein